MSNTQQAVAGTKETGRLMVLHGQGRETGLIAHKGPFREALWWQHLKRQVRSHGRPDLSSALLRLTRKQMPGLTSEFHYARKTLGTVLWGSVPVNTAASREMI